MFTISESEASAPFDPKTAETIADVLKVLSPAERKELLTINPWKAWATVVLNWSMIFGAMAMVVWAWPNPLLTWPAIILALFIIGCRQLGMAIVMHEAGHHSMFKNRKLNDFVGNWLGAYPIWLTLAQYRKTHLVHHTKTGTEQDPDIGLVKPFPITPTSLRRKLWRDLSGQTFWKFSKYKLSRTFSLGQFKGQDPPPPYFKQMFWGMVISNGVLLGILTLAGYPALYLLWLGAYFTTNAAVTRIRAIAEHSMAEDMLHPLKNTRTTIASWPERLFIAPNYVNYHLEHHLMMTVPHYNLPRMHEMLKTRGVYDEAEVTYGYKAVLERAASKVDSTPQPLAA